jgi:hypothetical protein
VSPDILFFFSCFDETTTLDDEGLIETVLHLNLGYFFLFVAFLVFCFCVFFFFVEKMTELLHRQ